MPHSLFLTHGGCSTAPDPYNYPFAMKKNSKKNLDAFKSLALTPKATKVVKGGAAEIIIVEEVVDA